jgi:hypothetical protein
MDLLYTFWVDASTENIYLGNDDSLAKIINVLRSFRCLCVASALKRQILSDRAHSKSTELLVINSLTCIIQIREFGVIVKKIKIFPKVQVSRNRASWMGSPAPSI